MGYCAFISYAHADAAAARWLLRRLETFRVPKRLVGMRGTHGVVGVRLGRFFRDREELAAADDLGSVVRQALKDSDSLIVICSPAAARSRWVNAEIQAFQELGRHTRVYGLVVAGTPGSEDEAEKCFPPAMITRAGHVHEPMAADARRAGDGRGHAFIKLVAGILGINYDLLARREAQRRAHTITAIAVASTIGMIAALALAGAALIARNDAARRQAQAEDILGFMVGDLRSKLTAVGRLDLMHSVDDKATAYFATLKSRDLTNRALEQQARLLTGIGQVRTQEGQHDAALAAFQEAYARSEALYERSPNNGQRLFDLAQAEYWVGWVAFQQARYDDAEIWLRRYRDSGVRLAASDRSNFTWQKELAYGAQNLAILDEKLGRYAAAEDGIQAQLALYRKWLVDRPDDVVLRYEAANAASWLSTVSLRQGELRQSQDYASEAVEGLQKNIAAEPANMEWLSDIVDAYLGWSDAQAQSGRLGDARAKVDQAVAAALVLTAHDSTNNEWRVSLGNAVWHQAVLPRTPAEADERARTAIQVLEAARQAEPKSELIVRLLARAKNTAAIIAASRGETTRADAYLAEALGDLEPLWDRAHSEDLRLLLAQTYLVKGDFAARRHDAQSARIAWTSARDLLLEGAIANSPPPFARLEHLVSALYRLGEAASAAPYRQRLDEAGFVPRGPFTPSAAYATLDRGTAIASRASARR